MSESLQYTYCGAVYQFDSILMRDWQTSTRAVSEKQAMARILGQAKKRLGYSYSAGGFRLKGVLTAKN